MHLVSIVASIVLLVAGYVLLFKSLSEQFEMQHEINRKLPASRQFQPTFWTIGTRMRFRQLQREFLPDSPRPRRFRKYNLIGFVLMMSGLLLMLATIGR